MPESTLPLPLRRGLSQFEQNVLLFGQRGGVDLVARELGKTLRTKAEAADALLEVRVKAAGIIERERERARAVREAAPVAVDPPAADSPTAAPTPPVPSSTLADEVPAAPANGNGAHPPTMPRRGPGELRAAALAFIGEHGPVRQAAVRDHLGIGSPQMAGLVRQLEARLVIGPLEGRSPLLSLKEEGDEDAGRAGMAVGDDVEAGAAAGAGEEGAPSGGGDGGADLEAEGERDEEAPAPALTQEETARLAGELLREAEELAAGLDAVVSDTLLRARYLAALLRRIEQGDTSPELLDRFERLAGFAHER